VSTLAAPAGALAAVKQVKSAAVAIIGAVNVNSVCFLMVSQWSSLITSLVGDLQPFDDIFHF